MYLFVYGTLLSTIPSSMSKFLGRRATRLGVATVSGELYDLGMYPGFQSSGGAKVTGELFELEESKAKETMSMLNAYEGVTGEPEDEYRLEKITCDLGGKKVPRVSTYVSKRIPTGAAKIPTGDYHAFYRANVKHQRFVNGG